MNSSVLVKSLAIASSLLLMAVFVGYRAGAFEWLSNPTISDSQLDEDEAAKETSASDTQQQVLISPNDPVGESPDKHMFYSSKSGAVMLPTDAQNTLQPGPVPNNDTTIISGTKTLLPAVVPEKPDPPDPPTSQDDTIMLGPKSPGGF